MGNPASNGDNPAAGTAYVFVEPSGGWTNGTQTAELTASDGLDGNDFGASVSIAGNTIVSGAYERSGINNGPGEVYVFVEPPNGWVDTTETAILTASDGGGELGLSVSMAGDTIIAGSPDHGTNAQGAVYVFVKPTGGWVNATQTAELTVDPSKLECLGDSVSIAGNIVLAGADCTQGNTGAAYVFVKPAGGWQSTSRYTLRLSIPFKYQSDEFGAAVAITGTTGIVGAPYAPTSLPCRGGECAAGPGEAFVFTEK